MKFLDLFRSQAPNILKRLQDIQAEVDMARFNIRKLAKIEKKLVEQEASSRSIEKAIDGFEVALWTKDTDGRFLYVNKACCEKILKCSQAEALNLKNGDLKKDALAQVCMRSDMEVLKNRKTQRWIEHAIYEDGRNVFIDTVKSPVYNGTEIVGLVGNAVDITGNVPELIRRDKSDSVEIPLEIVLSQDNLFNILGGLHED